MALPTIVSVSEDALQAVGRELREGSYALGATRAETLVKVVIPAAASGIAAAVILGVMRAVGETMVVWMAAGNAAHIPEPWYNFLASVRTLTATIAGDMGEADQSPGSSHYHALFAMALCLLAISFVLNMLSEWAVHRRARRCGDGDMRLGTRKLLDRATDRAGHRLDRAVWPPRCWCSSCRSSSAGMGAFVFRGTIEYRQLMLEKFGRGNLEAIEAERAEAAAAQRPVYDMLAAYKKELTRRGRIDPRGEEAVPRRPPSVTPQEGLTDAERADAQAELDRRNAELDRAATARRARSRRSRNSRSSSAELLGPAPGDTVLRLRDQYGQTRWDRAQVKLDQVLNVETWVDQDDPAKPMTRVLVPRADVFEGTALAPLFPYRRKPRRGDDAARG